MAGAALCVACIAWAGSPTSQSVIVRTNVLDVEIGQTGDLAADAIDTLIVDLSRAMWKLDNASDKLFLQMRITTQGTAAESLTVDIDVSGDGSRWDGTEALNAKVLNGSMTDMVELLEWGRFLRIRILNQDDDAHSYDILLSALAR